MTDAGDIMNAKLNYRLISPVNSMTVRFDAGDENLKDSALNVVMEAFSLNGIDVRSGEYIPEILSDRTLMRIAEVNEIVYDLKILFSRADIGKLSDGGIKQLLKKLAKRVNAVN